MMIIDLMYDAGYDDVANWLISMADSKSLVQVGCEETGKATASGESGRT